MRAGDVVLYWSPNSLDFTRLVIIAPRMSGQPHERNRRKRQVREAFRQTLGLDAGLDVAVRLLPVQDKSSGFFGRILDLFRQMRMR